MRILFDQGTPAPLRRALTGHSIFTAHEMGWAQLGNGDLLRAAELQFDVFVTTDRNLRYQQNVARLRLAILVLPTTNWASIRLHEGEIGDVIATLHPGQIMELNFL